MKKQLLKLVFKKSSKTKYLRHGLITKQIAFISVLFSILLISQASFALPKCKKINDPKCSLVQSEDSWVIIYADSLLKISCQPVICEGIQSIQLRVENLSNQQVNYTYKLSISDKESRIINLFPIQILEGICSADYKNLMIEQLPKNFDLKTLTIKIYYQPN